MRRLVWALVLLASWSACATAALRAQATVNVPGGAVRATIERGKSREGRYGGFGIAEVVVTNASDRAQVVRLEVRNDAGFLQQSTVVETEPGSRTSVRVPATFDQPGWPVYMRVDDGAARLVGRLNWTVHFGGTVWSSGQRHLVSAYLGADRVSGVWDGAFGAAFKRVDAHGSRITESDLPSIWWMATGYDLLVVGCDEARLDAGGQRVLERFAFAGGVLALIDAGTLGQGPLREAVRDSLGAANGKRIPHGLGWIVLCDARDAASGPPAALVDVVSHAARRDIAFTPPSWVLPLDIPGLGGVPMGLFVVLMFAFVVGVGPLNYIALRRRGQLAHLIWTVPALGLGTTLLVMGVAVVKDGFGSTKVVQTTTFLDQVRHVSACKTRQSVFAAFSPGRLQPHPETMFVLPSITLGGGAELRWQRNADGSLAGGLIQARAVTPVTTTTVRTERARLRFARRGGRLAVLPDEGIVPVADALFVRDFDGTWYVPDGGRSSGDLVPAVGEVTDRIQRALLKFVDRLDRDERSRRFSGSSPAVSLDDVGLSRTTLAAMPPGSYVCVSEAAPWHETLGLDADTVREHHVVLGRLAAEDIDG